MKRHPELRDFSEQHHHGLVAARRLRLAAQGEAPLEEAVARFLDAWYGEIQPHFRAEEETLLPEYARVMPADDPLIVRTLTEHVGLRRVVRDLERAVGEQQEILATVVGMALADHIRFEERVLFPAVEAAMEEAGLAELGREFARS
jgi:hemerythrin-like domain-containing protein